MIELAISYITFLDRFIIDAIKWLIDNDLFMCSIPIFASVITLSVDFIRGQQIFSTERYMRMTQPQEGDISEMLKIISHEEYEQMKERIKTLE